MSKIDYQALREAAERAIPAMERLLMLPADDDRFKLYDGVTNLNRLRWFLL